MAGFTNTYEAAILDHVFGKATLTPPTIHVALFTTLPADDATGGVEVSAASYARVATVAADWNAAVAGAPTVLDNLSVINFPQATESWGTVIGFGLYTAATAGILILYGALGTNRAIATGDTPEFGAGLLKAKLGDPGDIY